MPDLPLTGASVAAQRLKKVHLSMQEMWVQSLGWEAPLEKEMATHSSVLGREIPKMEEPDWLQPLGLQKSRYN